MIKMKLFDSKEIEIYKFIMLYVFHYNILSTISTAFRAIQCKATDLSNDLKCLKKRD